MLLMATRLLGIASSRFKNNPPTADELTWEMEQLLAAASAAFDDVTFIDPRRTVIAASRTAKALRVFHDAAPLDDISALIVRSTAGAAAATAALALALHAAGTIILDGLARFDGSAPGKSLSTLRRWEAGIGSDSYVVFGPDAGRALLGRLQSTGWRPMISKPAGGAQGSGVIRAATVADGYAELERWRQERLTSDEALLIQPDMEFTCEWRVLVLGGRSLGAVRKFHAAGVVVANASMGGVFERVEEPAVEHFVESHVASGALVGVDVALAPSGEIHIIEENYSPQWRAFEAAIGTPVGPQIVEYLAGEVRRTSPTR